VVVVAQDSDAVRSHPAALVADSATTSLIKTKLAAEHLASQPRAHSITRG
jgi:hypothetical protein